MGIIRVVIFLHLFCPITVLCCSSEEEVITPHETYNEAFNEYRKPPRLIPYHNTNLSTFYLDQ